MPKIYGGFKRKYVQSIEILGLINKANQLTDGDGYQLYTVNAESLERVLDKILAIARQEKEWYCYFYTLYEMLYLLDRVGKHKKILKYAEVFYRDSTRYLDFAVPSYPDVKLGEYSTWSYNMIYSTYKKFPQITDEKMEEFMNQYRESVRKYGQEKSYYGDALKLALLYKDVKKAKQAKEGLEQSEIKSCYLCAMTPVLGYYLLCEDYESLEYMIDEFRTRSIPMQHRWCYKHCYLAEDKELVMRVLGYCLLLGRSEYFHKLLENNRDLFQVRGECMGTSEAYYYACLGDWTQISNALERTEDDIKDWKNGEQSALGYLYDCLCWHCYFTMLDEQGTHEVATALAGKEVPETKSGECSCMELSAFFETEADRIGTQMEASRKKFDYQALKQSYHECMDIARKG